jgi:hypothetical protein
MFESQTNETLQDWIKSFDKKALKFKSAEAKKRLEDTRKIIQRRRQYQKLYQ